MIRTRLTFFLCPLVAGPANLLFFFSFFSCTNDVGQAVTAAIYLTDPIREPAQLEQSILCVAVCGDNGKGKQTNWRCLSMARAGTGMVFLPPPAERPPHLQIKSIGKKADPVTGSVITQRP